MGFFNVSTIFRFRYFSYYLAIDKFMCRFVTIFQIFYGVIDEIIR